MSTSAETRERVLAIIEENAEQVRALSVRRLGLFGSFARGQQGPESDVDLLVQFEPDQKSFDDFIHLSFLLEDLLKRRVELVTAESLSPYIRPRIFQEVQYASLSS